MEEKGVVPTRTPVEEELVRQVAWQIRLRWIAGTGVLLYFHFTSPDEEAAARAGVQTVGLTPVPGGGAAFGLTGRF